MDWYWLRTLEVDWVAIIALIVSFLSFLYMIRYNRKTLRQTKKHNKKMIEPLITDMYESILIKEQGKDSHISYYVKNCGLGPAIIKDLIFNIDGKEYKNIFEVSNVQNYISDKSEYFTLEQSQVLAPNDKLLLFEVFYKDAFGAALFHAKVKHAKFYLKYETIYNEEREFIKERLSTY